MDASIKINPKRTALLAALGIAGIAAARMADRLNIGIPCILHEATGLWCPGCGMTRMMKAISRGDFCLAARYNLAGFMLMPLILFMAAYLIGAVSLKGKALKAYTALVWCSGAALILFGVLRNIPAFVFLAPNGGK